MRNFLFYVLLLFFGKAMLSQTPSELVLDNGTVKVKMDMNSGGAISYISESNSNYNVVNIHDKGRFIQQSYYAGQDLDRTADGQSTNWSPWPWNPIQAGDVFNNVPQILDYSETPTELYVKNVPMLWDMNNESAEAIFESWITLENNVIHVRNKLTINRTDNLWTQIIPRHQELPAVYTIADLDKLYTYTGTAPFTNDALSLLPNVPPPWQYWTSYESWAAYVNSSNWGLGVFNKDCVNFIGGFSGTSGGGANDSSTGYISPLITKAFGPNEVFEYEYDLILGSLQEIRDFAYDNGEFSPQSNWEFNVPNNTDGWMRASGISNMVADGSSLDITINANDPFLYNLDTFINPTMYDHVIIGLKNETNDNFMQLFWRNDNGSLSPLRSASLTTTINDTAYQEYAFDLSGIDEWTNGGLVTALRIDPPGDGNVVEKVYIDYIRLSTASCIAENTSIIGPLSLIRNDEIQYTGNPNSPANVKPWKIDNENIATVNDDGIVTGINTGNATLTFTTTDGCLAVKELNILDFCHEPATQSSSSNLEIATPLGITSLGRAQSGDNNWPGIRKGGYLVLEAKNKGFVITRLTEEEINLIPSENLVEGMLVYDKTNGCMKLYNGTSWKCYNKQTCP